MTDKRFYDWQTSFGVATGFDKPRRLCAGTRALAAKYVSGEIGRTIKEAAFSIDPAFLAAAPTPNQQYAEAIRLIAEKAPLRILPGERLAGAATLKEAMWHRTPLTPYPSISHTTLGFDKVLRIGLAGIRAELDARVEQGGLDDKGADLLQAMRTCLDAAGTWHGRYLAALEFLAEEVPGDEDRLGYAAVLDALRAVPENPPRSFREAVQALWMAWDFQRLCGNWSGIGRIDKMLGPFLAHDLKHGIITLDDARELIAHFWIKGCEWITAEGQGSGDAQFYQNIVLAGIDEDGNPVANAVTDLVLDVVEELHISDFPIAVRVSASTPESLLRRIADIQRLGGGIIAIYNEDRIVANLVKFGYPLKEARDFANDGCWEILIPGKTAFGYQPFDALLPLQETLGLSRSDTPPKRREKIECSDWEPQRRAQGDALDFRDFESLYGDYVLRLRRTLEPLLDDAIIHRPARKEDTFLPCPLLSLLVEDCIGRARSYAEGGPKYTVRSPHAGGLPDVVNSLLVIRRLVYEQKLMTLGEFVDILKRDWEGQEPLRRRIETQFDFYGNDSADVDSLMQRVFNDYTGIVAESPERHGVLRPAGISTFGREGTTFLPHRTATASGKKRGAVLAPNFSPSPGTDKRGPTSVIRSHCAVDFSRLPCGTALDLKILPSSVQGESGLQALVGLMRAFVDLGGIFMQTDVVDGDLLRDAQANPDKYPNLSVRISGWSARFATLTKEWQDMVIVRTEHAGCESR
jgi:formate C-acetyltransferase